MLAILCDIARYCAILSDVACDFVRYWAILHAILGDIHLSCDIARYRAIFMNIAAIFMNIAAIFMNNAQYRIDAFSISMVRSGQIVGSIHIHISPNKRRGRLFTQQPLMGGRLFNFLQRNE